MAATHPMWCNLQPKLFSWGFVALLSIIHGLFTADKHLLGCWLQWVTCAKSPCQAAQGCSHEENDNSPWFPINTLGVREDGDRLLTSAQGFKHPSPLGVNVRSLAKGGCWCMFCCMAVSGGGLAGYCRDVTAPSSAAEPFCVCS